jgi:hypothetical protein
MLGVVKIMSCLRWIVSLFLSEICMILCLLRIGSMVGQCSNIRELATFDRQYEIG